MPTHNPLTRLSVGVEDEHRRPDFAGESLESPKEKPQTTLFERVDPAGYMSSSTWSIGSRHSQDTGEYEMSVVNDSGVYLPLPPTDDDFCLPHGYRSRASTDTRSSGPYENEPFVLSRGSLDSFRRSFDIRAKSPILSPSSGHVSLSASIARSPRRIGRGLTPQSLTRDGEVNFESVSLSRDSAVNGGTAAIAASKDRSCTARRRSFFAMFGGDYFEEEEISSTKGGGSGSKGSNSGSGAASRSHDGWSQTRSEWSPWGRDNNDRGADNHGPVAIAFRGAGGAVLRR